MLTLLVMDKAAKEKSMTCFYACMLFSESIQLFILVRIVINVPLPAGAYIYVVHFSRHCLLTF